MLQALTTLLTNKMVILTLFCSLVLYNPLLRAGGYGASFGIDLQDTNQINSLYFPDSLQLAIDSVRFENDIDTALNHGFLWASPSASGNLAGAMPLIKAKHNPKEFLVSFLSWNNRNTGITNRTANNITVLNINTSDNFSMQYSATAGNLLHNTDISSGNFKLTHFFFLGNSSHPAPMAMSLDNINDQYLLQWPVDNPAGISLMARAHRTSLVPQFDAFPLTWTHDGSRQDSTTDSGYVSTVAAEQGYSDAIFLKSQGGREIVTILGPVCYKTMRYACNSENPKNRTIYVRWETLATGTQNYFGIAHIDSIEPTVPAQNYYNLSIADDANGNVLACWTENIGGSEIWCQAFDASRNKIGTPLQVEALAGTRDRISEGIHRTYAIGAMDVGHFMITYSQNNRIYLRSIQLGAGSISRGSARLVSPAGNFCAFPNLAINSNHIAVAYFRHAPDASNRRIEIIRMERQGLSLPVADTTIRILPRNITFTTQLTERRFQQSYNSPAIAVDTLGNILVGYNYEMDARITSFVNVPVYFNNGAYTSNALELRHPLATSPLTSGDSVQFTALQLMGERTNAAQVFLQTSPQSTFSNAQSLGDQTTIPLTMPTLAADNFYRYQVQLQSDANALYTPSIDSVYVGWNLQPRKPILSRITIGTQSNLTTPWHKDTVYSLTARQDSLFVELSAQDQDIPTDLQLFAWTQDNPNSPMQISGTDITVLSTNPTAETFADTLVFPPLTTLQDTLRIFFSAYDGQWFSTPETLLVAVVNRPPQQNISLTYRKNNALSDTVTQANGEYWVEARDSLRLNVYAYDPNDTNISIAYHIRNSSTVWMHDTVYPHSSGDTLRLRFPSYSNNRNEPDTVTITTFDNDTAVSQTFYLLPSNPPVLDSLSTIGFTQNNPVWELIDVNRRATQDAHLLIHPNLPVYIRAQYQDADIIWGDSVLIEWHKLQLNPLDGLCCLDTLIGTGDTLQATFAPAPPYRLRVVLQDLTGLSTEDTVTLIFPYLDTTGSDLTEHIAKLTDSLDFLLGGGKTKDTVFFEIPNNGLAPLRITSIKSARDAGAFLDYLTSWPGSNGLFVQNLTDSSRISAASPIIIAPNQKAGFSFFFDLSSVQGDSIIMDTLYVETNDFHNPLLKIPFTIEYNDLPTLTVYQIHNATSTAQTTSRIAPFFPIYSSLVFAFSEPVDTRNIQDKIKIYSYPDSTARGTAGISPIESAHTPAFKTKRSAVNTRPNYFADTLLFTPNYLTASDYFDIQPPPHSFMHSDTLRIFVSNSITDAWGNALDLRNNNIPLDTGTLDTTLTAYVDTSFLQITYHTPAANDTVLPNESIQIHFNYPLATNCIFFTDTIQSLDLQSAIEDSNHTVRITSSLSNSSYIPIKPLQLTNDNHTLLIKPRYNLFSEDTVFVRISHTICDENGRTLDGNYDRVYHYPADTADYYEFSFYTGPADYYIFPNPFNFRNPEHVAKGGVAFKNLHRIPKIKVDDEIDLRIYTLDGLLVYSTHRLKKSILLNEEGSVPEITWPIRNNHNRIVASGLYLYTIGHGHTILQKGKIAIIR